VVLLLIEAEETLCYVRVGSRLSPQKNCTVRSAVGSAAPRARFSCVAGARALRSALCVSCPRSPRCLLCAASQHLFWESSDCWAGASASCCPDAASEGAACALLTCVVGARPSCGAVVLRLQSCGVASGLLRRPRSASGQVGCRGAALVQCRRPPGPCCGGLGSGVPGRVRWSRSEQGRFGTLAFASRVRCARGVPVHWPLVPVHVFFTGCTVRRMFQLGRFARPTVLHASASLPLCVVSWPGLASRRQTP
jgi:hypothetical protein